MRQELFLTWNPAVQTWNERACEISIFSALKTSAILILCVAIVGWGRGIFAQSRSDATIGRIEARLLQAERKQGFSGVVLVSRGEDILFHNSYGWAGPDMSRKNSLDRRFMIASVSKAFAAASILQLEEQGKLSIDDFIGEHLSGYPEWAGLNITIHQLLNHTSGIPDYINDRRIWFKLRQISGWTPDTDALIASFQNRPLNFHPGERFKYSNSGYVLLAKIVENVSGLEYGDYLYEHILSPLGMTNTGVGDFDMVGNRAVAFNNYGGKLKPIANFKSELIFGMGEMFSTTGDLSKWLHSFADTMVLSEASKEKMLTSGAGGYGLGWHVNELVGHRLVSHGGYLPGWNSYVFYFPDDTLSVIVVSNSESANPIEMCTQISRIFFLNQTKPSIDHLDAMYSGRYEILDGSQEAMSTPFESEILTINEDDGALNIRTPRGKTLRFTWLSPNEWTDASEGIKVQFKDSGKGMLLHVVKNGQEWQWKKLAGEYKISVLEN